MSKKSYVIFYDYSKLYCDICKEKFPREIEVEGKKIIFLDMDNKIQKKNKYLLFEVYDLLSD